MYSQLFVFKKFCFSYEIPQISVFSPVKPSKLWVNSYYGVFTESMPIQYGSRTVRASRKHKSLTYGI